MCAVLAIYATYFVYNDVPKPLLILLPGSLSYSYTLLGTLYTYLACGVGSKLKRAFRTLTHGYNHWASGRLDQLQVHTMHPQYCHIRGTTTPSMKPGSYLVYILLHRNGQISNIETATCDCAAG